MARNPILQSGSSAANLAKAETTIVAQLPRVLGKATIPINGKPLTAAQIVALLEGHMDALATLDQLRANITTAVQSEHTQRTAVKTAVTCIRDYVAVMFGTRSTQYMSLGFEPRKPAATSAEVKAQAIVKLRATRKARNTMGKVQKSKIFGTVPAAPAPDATDNASTPAAPSGGGNASSLATGSNGSGGTSSGSNGTTR